MPVNINNCGCQPEVEIIHKHCNECTPNIPCDCPVVDLDTKCILFKDEDIKCGETTVITKNLNLTDNLKNLVAYICQRFAEGVMRLVNIGGGAEIYAGDNLLGHKRLRTIISADNSVTVTQTEENIDLSVTFNQDNFVRQILIEETNLPTYPFIVSEIIDYILDLPEAERTIDETTSKVNIIIYAPSEGGMFIYRIYELQNIGKGIITSLVPDNLLLIKPDSQDFQSVLNVGSNLTDSNDVTIDQTFRLHSGTGGDTNGIFIFDSTYTSSTIPFVQIGKGMGNSSTDVSLNFLPNRTIFTDALNSKGIEYSGDYESNFTDRSLITKQFFEDNSVELTSGITTTVSGDGLTTPYQIETVNLQKSIDSSYALTAGDNNYSIKVDNGATPVTITVPTGLPENFFVGITQKGTGDVTLVGAVGVTLSNPVGLKIQGQGYHVGVEQIGTTNTFDILANTKA